MRTPIVAMLWEQWRLTRSEAGWRLLLGIVAGSALLALPAADAGHAFLILLALHASFWMSIAKLNGGRLLDGYRPGFPLHLLYARPVRTGVVVGAAMAYDAVSCVALYLVSAGLLEFAFGQPLPLLSVVVWIVSFHMVCTAVQWSTRNRVVQYLGTFGICMPFVVLLISRWAPGQDDSLLRVEFSLAENVLMAVIGLASFGLTVAGVARQRRGDTRIAIPGTAGPGGYPEWLVSLFRLPCPISSATRGQVWFELRSSGLPVLTIGGALAIVIVLLAAVSNPVDAAIADGSQFWARFMAVLFSMFSPLIVLFLGGNAFGIRRKQGSAYMSAFEATQACGTAQLTALKLLARSACVVAALIAVGVSIRMSVPLLGDAVFIQMWNLPLSSRLSAISGAVAALTWYERLALVGVTAVGIVVLVAALAVLQALRTRYSRRVNIAASSLLLSGLALALLALAAREGIVSRSTFDAIFATARWIFFGAMAFTTVYVFWSGFAERVLTIRYASGAVAISAAFGAAWLTALQVAGVQLAPMPVTDAVSMLLPALLPLMAGVLAPWSLSRVRHT
jgi:hypothetical protein